MWQRKDAKGVLQASGLVVAAR